VVGERERQQVTSPWARNLVEAIDSQPDVVGNPDGHLVWSARERGEREKREIEARKRQQVTSPQILAWEPFRCKLQEDLIGKDLQFKTFW